MSPGASAATMACDVGTQSISPTTNTSITQTNIATEPLQSRNRNEPPMSSIAVTSLRPGAKPADQRVTRNWNSVTSSGLMITMKPQVEGDMPWDLTAEIGSTVSYATETR